MAQVLGDLSRSRCLEVAGLAFTTGVLDPETLGCRTHLWAVKAAGVGMGLEGGGGAGRGAVPAQTMAYGQQWRP